jgi:hypothetical protein
MDGPMREVAFSQTHRRTHRRRNIVVSQFDDTQAVPNAGLAWQYIVQTGEDAPWTPVRRVPIALEASDEEVVQTVVRYLAGLGWDRDPAVAPAV